MTLLKTWLRPATCALALVGAVPALADEAAPVATEARAPQPARPALWKVADDDTTIWLFGTIHILPEDVAWYSGPVAAAFDASRELVTEIPIDKTQESQGMIAQKSLREDGKTLRETLTDKERAAYEAGMGSIGLPPQMFDKNDAWFAALMLTLIPLKVAGYNLESGVDTQVSARAKARHMENEALETAEYQISLFDGLSGKTQRRYLDQVVEAMPTVQSDIGKMVAAWKAGKADELADLLNEEEDDPKLRKVLLTNRNKAWAKWLRKRLDTPGTVFVAVGAGHLAGKDSVQDQLERRGVKSVRVQ
ncbi:TraB/GumN family protein [Novosphingobium mangrovi (ex Huang et al. 2023)]|uniref:TraB/GumN family protein n=1 Tax=Novosphingobium mangrovi (ex Huang et al. 2023) TaxID=2976432 RepID=A0ABT2I7H0_9SPHN|nr:TraB/GumN family protein [Novosphingobium mangrovi (ex Huang et al. 2023)]MCT2400760.1 TraB/GumN family protein [Novosphingobium mangrovi (ex Huang et al. 2023)]